MRIGTASFVALAVACMALPARADAIEFTNWSNSGSETVTPTWLVEEVAGGFKVTVGIDPSSPHKFGSVTGLFFDLSPAISDSDISGETAPGGNTHTDFANNASKINGVTNLNLGNFDVVLGYANKAQLTVGSTIMFEVDDLGGTLSLLDWTRVGVRWQEVGANAIGDGSDKQVSSRPTPVPEPGTMAMLLLCAAAVAGHRRRRADSGA